jgi:hypothetical protein
MRSTAATATTGAAIVRRLRNRHAHPRIRARPTAARRSGASVALKNRKYGYAAPIRKPSIPRRGSVQAMVTSLKESRSRHARTARLTRARAISPKRIMTG